MGSRQREAERVVIIGSGLAGLSAALTVAARGGRALVVTKTELQSGSSPLAQGGLAAAVGPGDAPELHAADTECVGRGLCDRDVVRLLTLSAPGEVAALLEHGARLDRDDRGQLELGREAGHSRHRIVHAGGDRTGAELVRTLAAEVRRKPRIEVRENLFVVDLLRLASGRVAGVLAESGEEPSGEGPIEIPGQAVVLATGGAGQLYRYTTNPSEVTGDGIAVAARAGALLADLEMVQFHPTALALAAPGAPLALLTEALRGAGALVVDREGRRFLTTVHPDAELAPRDVVARELWRRSARGEASYLDLRGLACAPGGLGRRFPAAASACAGVGLDPAADLVPVTPAAHYFIGGVWTDAWGRSSLQRLYACGETAATGAHGANRLASNSLLEAVVFGKRVGGHAGASETGSWPGRVAARARVHHGESLGSELGSERGARDLPGTLKATAEVRDRLRDAMWRGAGVARTAAGLLALQRQLDSLASEAPVCGGRAAGELRNLLEVARLVAAAALRRRESRGCHFRADAPHERPELADRPRYLAADLDSGLSRAAAETAELLAARS